MDRNKQFWGGLEDEEDDDPEWVDFDPQKELGNFFGREIPNEKTTRDDFKVRQEKFAARKADKNPDIEDEFDAMVLENTGVLNEELEQAAEEDKKTIEQEKADLMGGAAKLAGSTPKGKEGKIDALIDDNGIDEKDVPQDIKDKITDIEMDQREKLKQTMLQEPSKKKTTALKNL